jgi:hypothetical protein
LPHFVSLFSKTTMANRRAEGRDCFNVAVAREERLS